MTNQTKFVFVGCLLLILCTSSLMSQIPPNDKNWQEHWIDNFDGPSGSIINPNYWRIIADWDHYGELQWYTNSLNNLYLDGQSHAVVKAINETVNGHSYSSAWFESIEAISYGYFEIKCQLPSGKGRWPAFWTYNPGICGDINIMERGGDLDNSTYTNSISWGDPPCVQCTPIEDNQRHVSENLTSSYNTFAVEWMPNHIIFYYNNKNGLSYLDDARVPVVFNNPKITINLAIDNWVNQSTTPFPSYFKIDWVKWYSLKIDCNTPVYGDNFDFVNFNYKLKKLFELKNSSLTSSQNVTLRATDYILLGQSNGVNGEFTVPINAELTILLHDCPNY